MENSEYLRSMSVPQAVENIEVYGIIILDLQGTVETWNQGATKLLGYSEEEALGNHFEFIFTAEDRSRQAPEREMANALSENFAFDDRWHLRRDQTRIYVNGGLCLMRNERGEPLGFIKIVRDQTEKKERLEQIEQLNLSLREAHESLHDYAAKLEQGIAQRTRQLKERNDELEAFCYSIAHDIRAPLRSIQSMSQVVVEDYGAAMDPTCREYLDRIARAGARLDQLTLDLLKYSRLSRDGVELVTTSLQEVVEEVIASLQDMVTTRGAEIEVTLPLPDVHAQHAYLVQIFLNLLSNALKFLARDLQPRIEIWAEAGPERVRVFVKDNGIGIPEEYREKIFQLFERLHPDGTFEGTGVGLAIAYKAAHRINGTIGLASTEGPGTTFWLELDLAQAVEKAA